MKVCVIAKLSLSESKREFLYYIFWVSKCEYTFMVYERDSIWAYNFMCSREYDIDQVKLIFSMDTDINVYMCCLLAANKVV